MRIKSSYRTTAFPAHSLEVASYEKKVQETIELRKGRMLWMFWGWLGVLGFAVLTGYVSLWCLCSLSTVGKVHLIGLVILVPIGVFCVSLTGIDKSKATFQSVGTQVGKGSATNFLVDRSESRADRDGFMQFLPMAAAAKPEAPGGGAGEAGPAEQPAPRVRERFPETMLWEPILIADDNGHVKPLDFTLADSITEWRLTASAVSAEGKLGAAQLPLKVFQPFFVELNLPVALTRGDEVGIPVVVYNYLDKPQTVTLNLDDAGWFERQGDAKLTLDLKPGEVRMTSYRIKVLRVGTQELQVKALGQGVGDALKRKIDVLPDGRRQEFVTNGTLQDVADVRLDVPANAIEGSVKAYLKIYPSAFSQVVEGLENIFQLPHGCFEQTSSTVYPNVLALDYLKRTGKSQPQVEAKARHYFHLGYQRLLTFEVFRRRLRLVRPRPGQRPADGLRPDGVCRHGQGPRRRSEPDRAHPEMAAEPAPGRRLVGRRWRSWQHAPGLG